MTCTGAGAVSGLPQLHLIGLAVDGDQSRADLAQFGGGHAGAAGNGPRPTRRWQHPGEDQFAVVDFRPHLGCQAGGVGMGIREQDSPFDPGHLSAHQPTRRAGTHQHLKRSEDHRLTGTGFPSHHREARTELHLGRFDHTEAGDGEVCDHAGPSSPVRQPSTGRWNLFTNRAVKAGEWRRARGTG